MLSYGCLNFDIFQMLISVSVRLIIQYTTPNLHQSSEKLILTLLHLWIKSWRLLKAVKRLSSIFIKYFNFLQLSIKIYLIRWKEEIIIFYHFYLHLFINLGINLESPVYSCQSVLKSYLGPLLTQLI